jgi:hypothetical protein
LTPTTLEMGEANVAGPKGLFFRARIGRQEEGNYAAVFNDTSGGREMAGIGESTTHAGLAFVADEYGQQRVRLDGADIAAGARILNDKGLIVAALGQGEAYGGNLTLYTAAGTGVVEMGATDTGVGVVRVAGPKGFSGFAGLGLPGTEIVGKR